MNRTIHVALAAALLAVTGGALAQAQAQMQLPQARPAHGQSADRQSRDESACVTSARKRTGLDPYVLAENSTPLQPGKGITSVPIEAPSMAMGSSGAGSETGTQPAQAGAMGASAGGQTAAGGGQMGAQGGMAGGGQMGTQGAQGGMAGGEQMGAQGGTAGASGAMGASGSTGETGAGGQASTGGAAGAGMSGAGATGAAGSSGAAGATGAGGTQMAQHNTADVFNRAFARCMTSRGYIVESASQGGTP